MKDKLKPCPFCKSKNIIDCYVYMACGNCHAKGPVVNNGAIDDHVDYMDHQLAIKLWNKRDGK